jgi:hypothetical protein
MNSLFSRIAIGGILAAGAIFAASMNDLTVTLPHAVTVGSTTLPSGTYTISPMEIGDGTEYFVVRGNKMSPLVLPATKIDSSVAAPKTEVTLTESGDTWRLDKLSFEGEKTGFEFQK